MAAPNPYLNPPSRLQSRTATPTGSRGSLTQTLASADTPDRTPTPDPLVLRLRGAHASSTILPSDEPDPATTVQTRNTRRRQRRIQWDENVIDNEGLGRKKSKVCCIYHKPRAVGESSDESSSDSSGDSSSGDESDSDPSFGDGARPAKNTARPSRNGGGKRRRHDHNHDHDHDHHDGNDGCGHDRRSGRGAGDRRPSPNAYERMPKYDVKPLVQQPGLGN